MSDGARVVLVETSDALPGLLPFQAWDALATADVVLVRDPEAHPSSPHLYFAGLDLERLEPASLSRDELNLARPGSPHDRRLAKALLNRAREHGTAVYLLGPDDDFFGRVVGSQSGDVDVEVEFVFYAQQPRGAELLRLVEVERELRDPEHGCPWDLEQDHHSLGRYLVEETYELLEAIDTGDDTDIAEELGDVLLQVVFHAQVATDRGAFTIDDVARGIADKLVHRHPHVFGDVEVADAQEVVANWDDLKQAEKQRTGPFEGVPTGLPALQLAEKLQRRAAKLGFDWQEVAEPLERIHQELDELATAEGEAEVLEEVGDLLGAVVGLARHHGVDPEAALRAGTRKFRRRFEAVLALARARELAPAALDRPGWLALWDEVKRGERDGA